MEVCHRLCFVGQSRFVGELRLPPLTLAALDYLRLPSRWVESAIAASIIVAATDNLFPLFRRDRWTVAFALGLVHGFGFASVLRELGLPSGSLALSLFGFNLGVEVDQLSLVGLFFPFAYLFRRHFLYRRILLVGGSLLATGLGLVWLIERALGVALPAQRTVQSFVFG